MKEVLAGAGVWGQRDTPLRTLSDLRTKSPPHAKTRGFHTQLDEGPETP